MGARLARAGFVLVAIVVVPLVAYRLAVAATNHGFGWKGFVAILLGAPVAAAATLGVALRLGRRDVAAGVTGAVAATIVLVVVVVFVTLDAR